MMNTRVDILFVYSKKNDETKENDQRLKQTRLNEEKARGPNLKESKRLEKNCWPGSKSSPSEISFRPVSVLVSRVHHHQRNERYNKGNSYFN